MLELLNDHDDFAFDVHQSQELRNKNSCRHLPVHDFEIFNYFPTYKQLSLLGHFRIVVQLQSRDQSFFLTLKYSFKTITVLNGVYRKIYVTLYL